MESSDLIIVFVLGAVIGLLIIYLQKLAKPKLKDGEQESEPPSEEVDGSEITLENMFDQPDDEDEDIEQPDEDEIVGHKKVCERDTVYLNYLCDLQVPNRDYFCCIEREINSNHQEKPRKEAYLFTVAETPKQVLFVYESIYEKRATYLIRARKYGYNATVKRIIGFFESTEDVNKRDTFTKHSEVFINKIPGVKRTAYLSHRETDFGYWKTWIDRNVMNMKTKPEYQ